jgi:hypothetical protein
MSIVPNALINMRDFQVMPGETKGELTDIQLTPVQIEALADHLARGLDLEAACEALGYLGDKKILSLLVSSPSFADRVAARRASHVQTRLVPVAMRELESLLTSISTPAATKRQLIMDVLKMGGVIQDQPAGKVDKTSNEPKAPRTSDLRQAVHEAAEDLRRLEAGMVDISTNVETRKAPNCADPPHKRLGGR